MRIQKASVGVMTALSYDDNDDAVANSSDIFRLQTFERRTKRRSDISETHPPRMYLPLKRYSGEGRYQAGI